MTASKFVDPRFVDTCTWSARPETQLGQGRIRAGVKGHHKREGAQMMEIKSRLTSVTDRERWAARGALLVAKAKATKAVWFPPKPEDTGKKAASTAKKASKRTARKTTRAAKKTANGTKKAAVARQTKA